MAVPVRLETSSRTAGAAESWLPADTTVVNLELTGVICGSCATTARLALRRVEGVYRAKLTGYGARVVEDGTWQSSTS